MNKLQRAPNHENLNAKLNNAKGYVFFLFSTSILCLKIIIAVLVNECSLENFMTKSYRHLKKNDELIFLLNCLLIYFSTTSGQNCPCIKNYVGINWEKNRIYFQKYFFFVSNHEKNQCDVIQPVPTFLFSKDINIKLLENFISISIMKIAIRIALAYFMILVLLLTIVKIIYHFSTGHLTSCLQYIYDLYDVVVHYTIGAIIYTSVCSFSIAFLPPTDINCLILFYLFYVSLSDYTLLLFSVFGVFPFLLSEILLILCHISYAVCKMGK